MGRNRDKLVVEVVYETDTASLNEAAASAAQVESGLVDLSAQDERLQESAEGASASIEDQTDALYDMLRATGLTNKEIADMSGLLEDAQGNMDDLESGATSLSRSPLFSGRVAAFAERVGLDPAAEALRAGRGGIEAAEAFKSIGPAITETTDAAKKAFESLSESLGISPGGLGAIAIAATIAIGATALILGNLAAESQKVRDAERARIDVLREAAQLAAEGETAQEALNRKFQAGIDIQASQDLITGLEEDLVAAFADFADEASDIELATILGGEGDLGREILDPMTASIEELEEAASRFALSGGADIRETVTALTAEREKEAAAIERQNQATQQAEDLLGGQNEAMAAARTEAERFEQVQRLLTDSTAAAVKGLIEDNQTLINSREMERRALEQLEDPSAAVQARLFEIGTEMEGLQETAASLILVADQLTISELALAEARRQQLAITNQVLDSAQRSIDLAREEREINERDVDAIREQIAATEAEIASRNEAIANIVASGEINEETAEQIAQYMEEQNALIDSLALLTDALPVAAMRAAAEEIRELQEEAAKDLENIAKKRADIEKKLADQILRAVEKAADAVREVGIGLQRNLDDLLTGKDRDLSAVARDQRREELELVIDDNRRSEKNLRQHLRRLQKLRRDSEVKEAELIQARDFRGLFNLRRQNRQRIQTETNQFAGQERDRALALAQERADNLRHFAEQRADRMVDLQRQISDAHLAAARRLDDINRRRNLELVRLQQSANQQLALLSTLENQKLAIVQRGAAAINAELQSMFVGVSQGGLSSTSTVTLNDNSTNTFKTGAPMRDVSRMVDRRMVRALRRVMRR